MMATTAAEQAGSFETAPCPAALSPEEVADEAVDEDDDDPPSFRLGAADDGGSQEILNSLQFSLAHSSKEHNRGGVHEDLGFVDREEIGDLLEEEDLKEVHFCDGGVDADAVSGISLAIHRVDSRDVVFDNRAKKAKVLGGNYVMGDVLGEGSYAKVKEAIDRTTLCRRAVKIMKRKKLRRIPHGEENVQKEIALLGELHHTNVMRLIEVLYNDEKGKIYMVLEFCCAVLKDMLDKSPVGKFPAWQAHFYFTQLVEGLEYLHSHRVIHKDIKPGNLLLDTTGVLKIADFGVAELLDRFAPDDMCRTSQGTPAFQPPEIANGLGSFPGFKVDVWSSGVTLYNFVTGSYPFEGDTIFRLFENIGKGEFQVPAHDVNPVLESLIRGMLATDFKDRFTLLQVRDHDWFKKKHPVTAPPVTVTPRDPANDPMMSTSVIPYLYDLHYGEEGSGNNEGGQDDFITEHEVNQIERARQAEQAEAVAAAATTSTKASQNSTRKEKNSARCIKQEGQLCGQHCLNALLQGPYYTAVDLGSIAQQLDEEERRRMGEAGEDSAEYRRFVNQPSSNMDDTGFFSVQVIANALNVWGLELVSYGSTSQVAVQARNNPTSQNAFICNYREHWFTIRKIGHQWFNLNSLLTGPELVTDTYLGMFLAQLETEGYTIYIVNGDIPESRADQVLRYVTVTQSQPPRLINEAAGNSGSRAGRAARSSQPRDDAGGPAGAEDADLRAAMAMSLEGATAQADQTEDEDMKLALQLSKSMMEQEEQQMAEVMSASGGVMDRTQDVSEEDQIQAAIAMSLSSPPSASSSSSIKTDKDSMEKLAKSALSSFQGSQPKPSTSKSSPSQVPKPPSKTVQKVPAAGGPSQPVTAAAQQQQQPTPVPKAPATVPGPSTMPGQGQRMTASSMTASRGAAGHQQPRQSTPDPDEVRRARLRFLEKKK